MAEVGCLKDGCFQNLQSSNLSIEGGTTSLPGYISLKDSGNNDVYLYSNKTSTTRGNPKLVLSTTPPLTSGSIEEKIIEWSYLNSMDPYYVPTHLGIGIGAQWSQVANGPEMNEGYLQGNTLLLMLSNLKNTYPLEMFNGLTWDSAIAGNGPTIISAFTISKAVSTVDASGSQAGLVYKGDVDADNQTIEITAGIKPSSPCALKAQTDAGYIEASFMSVIISDWDLVVVGFRAVVTADEATSQQTYNVANFAANSAALTGDPEYTDFACFGIGGAAGKLNSFACLNGDNSYADAYTTVGGNSARKDSGIEILDSQTFIVRVEVNTSGVVTYKYATNVASTTDVTNFTTITPDGSSTLGVQHTFDEGDIIVPFIRLNSGAGTSKNIFIKSIRVGKTN